MFGRSKAHAQADWRNISAPRPEVGIELNRNDLRAERNPAPFRFGFQWVFGNMQGGGLPTGNLFSIPGFPLMQNARPLNPPDVIRTSLNPTFGSNAKQQNAMGSSQASVPLAAGGGFGFANFGAVD